MSDATGMAQLSYKNNLIGLSLTEIITFPEFNSQTCLDAAIFLVRSSFATIRYIDIHRKDWPHWRKQALSMHLEGLTGILRALGNDDDVEMAIEMLTTEPVFNVPGARELLVDSINWCAEVITTHETAPYQADNTADIKEAYYLRDFILNVDEKVRSANGAKKPLMEA